MKQKEIKTKSRIDDLVSRKEELELMKERKLNAMHERNSKRETKIKKLENKAYQDKVATDVEVAEIDREINRTDKLIDIEREYTFGLAKSIFDKSKTSINDSNNIKKKGTK